MNNVSKKSKKRWMRTASVAMALAATLTFGSVMTASADSTTSGPKSWRDYEEFQSQYINRTEVREAALQTNQEIVEEGAVLIKNAVGNAALPLKKGADVTILGKNSINLVYQGSGSSGNAGSSTKTIYQAFEAQGINTNPVAKAFYENNSLSGIGRPGIPTFGNIPSGQPTGETRAEGAVDYGGLEYNLKEVDDANKNYNANSTTSNYNKAVAGTYNLGTEANPNNKENPTLRESYSAYDDAAVLVFSRIGGEGYDLPRSMVMNPTVGNNQYPAGNRGNNYTNVGNTNLANDTAFDNALMIPGARSKTSHYMMLDQNEINLLKEAIAHFGSVVVVLNSASAIELDFLDPAAGLFTQSEIDKMSVVWIATPGENGIMGLPKLLDGTVNPSGSLVDTYYKDFLDAPVMKNFSNNNVGNGNRVVKEDGTNTSVYFVDYQEDIYLGYRYYETAYAEELKANGKEAADEWYKDHVSYPFGHGESYTTFSMELTEWTIGGKAVTAATTLKSDDVVDLKVKVTNTGKVAGKKAVQIYANAPYTAGGIEKSDKVLIGYDKTGLIEAGKSETITISCPVYYFASWDGTDANGDGHKGYEIEAGKYNLYVASDAHDTPAATEKRTATFDVSTTLHIDEDPSSGGAITELFAENTAYMDTTYSDETHTGSARLSRENNFENLDTLTMGSERKVKTDEEIAKYLTDIKFSDKTTEEEITAEFDRIKDYVGFEIVDEYTLEHPAESMTYEEIMTDGISYIDMWNVPYDDAKWDEFMSQLTWEEMADLIANGNNIRFSSLTMANIGKPVAIHNDGPLGFSTKTNQGQMAFVEGTLETSGNVAGRRYIYATDNDHAPISLASTCLVAASMSQSFQYKVGAMLGEDALWGFDNINSMTNTAGYAPGLNTHRTPFSGRNFEYMSEDPVLGGIAAGQIMVGEQDYGNFSFVKHFFMNDQETNRDGNMLITWSTEQTLREIYGKSFEIAIKMAIDNNEKLVGVMIAYARLGVTYCGHSYQALTGLLRNEWGFNGDVITDWTQGSEPTMNSVALVLAGGSKQLGTLKMQISDEMLNNPTYGATYKNAIMHAAKDILFSDVNSNNIVVAKSVKTIQVNLNDKKYLKSGEALTFKVGEPLRVDLQKDVVDEAKPDVWYGDKSAVKYEYYMADGYTLPKGLHLTKDGVLYGVPEEPVPASEQGLVHVFVKATGKYRNETVEYYGGNQVLKMNIQGKLQFTNDLTLIEQESGNVNVKLGVNLSGAELAKDATVDYAVEGLPEGLTLEGDTIVGTVDADKPVTALVKVTANAFDKNGNHLGTAEQEFLVKLGNQKANDGAPGAPGAPGKDGANGKDGADGSGCGGNIEGVSVALAAFGVVTMLGAAHIIRRRKENN